jgi:uncharacterized protein YgbK (DUF1537 family)
LEHRKGFGEEVVGAEVARLQGEVHSPAGIVAAPAPWDPGVDLRTDLHLRHAQRLHASARGLAAGQHELPHACIDEAARNRGQRALDTNFTFACPAFPANGRTIYKGYLFVGNELLSESGMRNHPLTPMTDPSLVRVLQQQVKGKVGLADFSVVEQGGPAIAARFDALREEGCNFAVVDAVSNRDLLAIGEACADLPLVTGGSGIALGLPENFRRRGLLARLDAANTLPATGGARAVISGSCSQATQRQVALMREQAPAFHVDPLALARGDDVVGAALAWAKDKVGEKPLLVYATATPETVKAVQAELGVERAGGKVVVALADMALGLVKLGVGQLFVACGETYGAVVKALGISGLRIGPEIDPGVPWTTALHAGPPLALALKSGNFGSDDFFLKAWSKLA